MNARAYAFATMLIATSTAALPAPGNAPMTVEVSCPPLLGAKAVVFTGDAIPNGWKPYMPTSLEVRSGQLMYGPPEAQRPAIPLTHSNGKHARTAMWDFSDIPDDEKWLSCGYGKGGELTLSRPLPRAVSRCVVTVATGEYGWVDGVVVRCERVK